MVKHLIPIQTYIPPSIMNKVRKRKGESGIISMSAYLRQLVLEDIKKN